MIFFPFQVVTLLFFSNPETFFGQQIYEKRTKLLKHLFILTKSGISKVLHSTFPSDKTFTMRKLLIPDSFLQLLNKYAFTFMIRARVVKHVLLFYNH